MVYHDNQKSKEQTTTNSAILPYIHNKGLQNRLQRALSAIAGIMPLDLAMLLHKDIRAISRGQPTNAVLPELKKIEIPDKIKNTHPKDNHIRVDLTGTQGKANVFIYTDGSKTENHVGTSMVAVENSIEIHIETQRLNITCTVFQAEQHF